MTPNQRDLFLWSWSNARKRGRAANALIGAAIGAAGGVLFGLMLAGDVASGVGNGREATPGFPTLLLALEQLGRLFGPAVPAFAALAAVLIDRIWVSQETMYQRMIAQGHAAPTAKPVLSAGERGPQIAVFIAVGVIAAFIVVLWSVYG